MKQTYQKPSTEKFHLIAETPLAIGTTIEVLSKDKRNVFIDDDEHNKDGMPSDYQAWDE